MRIETLEGLFSELGPKHYATGTCNADLFFLVVRSTSLSILNISALICYCTHLSKLCEHANFGSCTTGAWANFFFLNEMEIRMSLIPVYNSAWGHPCSFFPEHGDYLYADLTENTPFGS